MSTKTEYRIELTAGLKVYIPIKPESRDAHTLLAAMAVSCA